MCSMFSGGVLSSTEHEEVESMNGPITSNEIESIVIIIKKSSTINKLYFKKTKQNKNPQISQQTGPDGFTGEFYQNIQKRVNISPSQTIPKYCRGRNTSQFILWGHHRRVTKTGLRYTPKKYRPIITDDHRCKNPQQNISKLNPTIYQKNHIP